MNNINILNDIMKPYFEKRAEIEGIPSKIVADVKESKEKLSDLRSDRLERKKALQLELESLRVRRVVALKEFEEKKEKEIEEYISASLNSNSNFYSNYGSMLRKDLERNYDRKLQELEEEFRIKEESLLSEIKKLSSRSDEEKEEAKEISDFGKKSDYTNVYLREMVELKDSLRIKLFAERKRLKEKLEELLLDKKEYEKIVADLNQKQLEFKELIDNIANFKYEYNDQNQELNIAAITKLHDKRKDILTEIEKLSDDILKKSSAISELNDINKALEKVEEYIKMTEPTKEETGSVMKTMTSWEKEEYDKRKGVFTINVIENSSPTTLVTKETSSNEISSNSDMIEVLDPVVSSYEIEDDKVLVDRKTDLLKAIFNDIISEVKRVRSVRINPSKEQLGADEYYVSTRDGFSETYEEAGTVNLYEVNEDPIQLPNGEYVYSKDMKEAVDNYYAKNKGKTYVVKSTGKEYNVNLGTIIKFKTSLKLCSALKLIRDNKIAKMDITRIHGKQKGQMLYSLNEIGTMYGKDKMPEGEYINRNELIAKLNNLFTTKNIEWLRNISEGLKNKTVEMMYKLQTNDVEEKTNIK